MKWHDKPYKTPPRWTRIFAWFPEHCYSCRINFWLEYGWKERRVPDNAIAIWYLHYCCDCGPQRA